MKTLIDTTVVVQSSKTGRFLLHQKDELWQFTVHDCVEEFSPLRDMIEKMKLILNNNRVDDLTFTYIMTKQSNFHLYHVWVPGEPLGKNVCTPYEWRSLFNFPADLHYTVDWAVQSGHFMETILRP